jgi:hypothetical protein
LQRLGHGTLRHGHERPNRHPCEERT